MYLGGEVRADLASYNSVDSRSPLSGKSKGVLDHAAIAAIAYYGLGLFLSFRNLVNSFEISVGDDISVRDLYLLFATRCPKVRGVNFVDAILALENHELHREDDFRRAIDDYESHLMDNFMHCGVFVTDAETLVIQRAAWSAWCATNFSAHVKIKGCRKI